MEKNEITMHQYHEAYFALNFFLFKSSIECKRINFAIFLGFFLRVEILKGV